MNYPQIRAFHAVAREGGVSRAAAALGVSQPTVSQHIKQLEDRCGMRLFEKLGRGLRLTEAGRDLALVTERLMREVDAVEAALSRRGRLQGGRLALISDNAAIAVELLDRFRRLHPSVETSIRMGSQDQVLASVDSGLAEAGVVVEPPASDAHLIVPLRTEPLWATLPRDHPASLARGLALRDLGSETLILREPGSRTRALTERALAAHAVTPAAVLEIGGREAIREAVARGMGVSLFAQSECPPDARLTHRPLIGTRAPISFDEHLIVRRQRRRQPAIMALLEIATRYAADQRTP
ncbi:MAG: LysR substrate-binding domain-containing protein [Rubrimonas sp.]